MTPPSRTPPSVSRSGIGAPKGAPLRRRPQLAEDVAVHVRTIIMSGGVRPGDFIRLDETAAELGVSVTPVREALLTLRGEGLVELVPHRGYVVAPLTRDDIADLFWLQGQIADELARRAAAAATPEMLDELAGYNDGLRAAVAAGDRAQIEENEWRFHRVLNRDAGARKLSWFLASAVRYTPVQFYSTDRAWGESAVESHERLVAALTAGDAETAAAENKAHFAEGATLLTAHLESIGMWD